MGYSQMLQVARRFVRRVGRGENHQILPGPHGRIEVLKKVSHILIQPQQRILSLRRLRPVEHIHPRDR